MTPEQLAKISVGDGVSLHGNWGVVKQTTPTWFMVTWEDGSVEIIRRTSSILTGRLDYAQNRKAL
jgi:hypothetical protein